MEELPGNLSSAFFRTYWDNVLKNIGPRSYNRIAKTVRAFGNRLLGGDPEYFDIREVRKRGDAIYMVVGDISFVINLKTLEAIHQELT